VAGIRVDHGSHRLHPSMSPRVRLILDELLGPDLQIRRRNGRLRLRDRWVEFPLRPVDMVANMPRSFVASSARDVLTKPLRGRANTSYADVIRTGLGPTALADFHGPMAQKLWGLPPESLSAELAHKRVSVNSASKLARTMARRASDRTFLYPRLGYGQIVDELAAGAERAGATITPGVAVASMSQTPAAGSVGGNGTGRVVARLSDGRTVTARRVLWTASAQAMHQATGDPARAAATDIAMRGLVLVYLELSTQQYTAFDAHYVPHTDVAFSRLSEPRNYRDGPDANDRTVLCAELPASVGDDVWVASDHDLSKLVTDGLAACDLPTAQPQSVHVKRLPRVYPVVTVEQAAEGGFRPSPDDSPTGVTVLGRQGLAVADNLHHVVDMG
ncbi:MAG: FAD-dependent oxidoreductase, partial [Acidimicrobiales bacterium]|nr:FAD-dependent oxidoreductase [Acidimicrobiales bacterium]